MSVDTQREIAQRILQSLYEAWERHILISLNTVQVEGGWDKSVFRVLVDRIEDDGLIKSVATSYSFEITTDGITRTEDNEIVPAATVERHRQIRHHILASLIELYDNDGRRAHAHYEKIAEGAPVDNAMQILKDLSYLEDLNEIEAVSNSTFRMTTEGYQNYRGAENEELI